MYRSFSDNPTSQDQFKIGKYITGLTQFIRNCETPLTIAIQGDWGTGKTSIMYQVEKQLKDSNSRKKRVGIKTIFFNTWQYSQFEMGNDLAASLLTDLINELEVSDSKKKDFFNKARSIFLKGVGYISPDFGLLNGEKIIEKIQEVTAVFEEQTKNIKCLKAELQALINDTIKEKYEKIVIFVDDLDRLAPEKAVELLEILKLFLDCEHCVFVLAIDYAVVIRGVKSKYGEDLQDEKGKAFFEKIIQVPFTVPVANYDLSEFIESSLERVNFSFRDTNLKNVSQLIRHSIGNNPRSINRLFNSVSLLLYIMNDGENITDEDMHLILAILCFQLRFEKAYNYVLTVFNNSSDESEDIEFYLIDLLENSFDLEDPEEYSSVRALHGDYKMSDRQEQEDFSKFYRALKVSLVGKDDNVDDNLTVAQFEKLLKKMSLSNAVAVGNTDTSLNKKIDQIHTPNQDVQYVMRQLFNDLTKTSQFDLSKPENFGKEDKKMRDLPLPIELQKIPQEYDRIQLTQGKGQGLKIYSSKAKSNFIYISGDRHGRMLNDGMGLLWNGECLAKVRSVTEERHSAKDLRKNEEKYKAFREGFLKQYEEFMELIKSRLADL